MQASFLGFKAFFGFWLSGFRGLYRIFYGLTHGVLWCWFSGSGLCFDLFKGSYQSLVGVYLFLVLFRAESCGGLGYNKPVGLGAGRF